MTPIPHEDVALAYELRQEYRMPWKQIARLLGYGSQRLCQVVCRAVVNGLTPKRVPPSVAQFAVSERAELLARITEQAREIERLEALSVTKVMLDIVPGDGDGYEVYAKSVSDVETKLGALGEENEDLQFEREQLRAELAAIKAQGVVIPPSPYMPGSQPTDFTDYELGEIHGRIAMWEEVKRLNAAPVQQVSVPDGWRVERGYSPSGYVLHSPSGSMIRVCDSGGGGIETAFALFLKAMLAALKAQLRA